jgi:hypothetical protein
MDLFSPLSKSQSQMKQERTGQNMTASPDSSENPFIEFLYERKD